MTTITLAIQWRGHQPGDTITVDQATAEWLQRTGATAPDPGLSNREHERRTGTHKNTVQAVREELEGSGQIAHFEKRQDPRTGADHKTVQTIRQEVSGDRKLSPAPVTGTDGKTYTPRPTPRPEPEPESEPDPVPAPEAPAEAPERPRKAAPVATWRTYAEAHGIDPKGLTKAEIIAATKGA